MEDSEIKTFETIIILTDEITDKDYEYASYHFRNMIRSLPATRVKTERLGKKTLAYDVRGHKEGYYLLFTYESSSDLIKSKLEPALRNDDNVIKFISLVTDKTYISDEECEQPDHSSVKPVDIFDLIFGIEN